MCAGKGHREYLIIFIIESQVGAKHDNEGENDFGDHSCGHGVICGPDSGQCGHGKYLYRSLTI